MYSQAGSRIRWTEIKKNYNKGLENSRSKNRTDGFLSQMVGFLPSPARCRFWLCLNLCVPCVTLCNFALFGYATVRTSLSGRSTGPFLRHSSHPRSLPFVASLPLFHHELHTSLLLVGAKLPFCTMSSDYSPPSSSGHHASREALGGGAASDANIRNFAPVARIMKTALPENAKIAKEAKECMQECVSEFISFITSEGTFHPSSNILAADRC